MTELSLLDRWLMFGAVWLMAVATVFYVAARTESCWRPLVRWFRSRSLPERVLILSVLFAVSVYGGSKGGADTNAPSGPVGAPRLRAPANPTLPAWYLAAGYPLPDTDGDGIPDAWEKWTHTDPYHADSGADPDADGLTNLEEFEAQTDPLCGDTDGDGLGDADEIAGLSAQTPDLDPLRPASFAVEEPDADADGIPDVWEGAPISPLSGLDPTGFPLDVFPPPLSGSNYDVVASVTSSRACALVWGDDSDESVLLPPCTNLAVRIRLSADAVRTVRLLPAPNAGSSPGGLWKARLSASWDDRRALETEGNRLMIGGGTAIDRSRETSAFVGLLPRPPPTGGGPLRTPMAWDGVLPALDFVPRRLSLTASSFCVEHGPYPTVEVEETNAGPPYRWEVNGVSFLGNERRITLDVPPNFLGRYVISCSCVDAYERLHVTGEVDLSGCRCHPGITNFVGAAWTSTHDPDDPSDHAPGIDVTTETFGPNCPVATNATVKLGFTHDENLLWIRNLVRIVTGDPKDDETDHCIAMFWSRLGSVDLSSMLDLNCGPHKDSLYFKVNDERCENNQINFSNWCPGSLKPDIYHVMLYKDGVDRALDAMWVVVNAPLVLERFDNWTSNNVDLAWTESLPMPFESIVVANGIAIDPEPPAADGCSGIWDSPHRIDSSAYLHHNAVWEMRTTVSGIHGNQATYDAEGNLIRSTIAGGTSDKRGPFDENGNLRINVGHRDQDVWPFIFALQLDGNPVHVRGLVDIPKALTRPCLRQGIFVETYLHCRPIILPREVP